MLRPGMEAVKGYLDLLLLAELQRGAGHGYALIERLRERSEGTFGFPEGTIYPALHRLEQDRARLEPLVDWDRPQASCVFDYLRDWRLFARAVEREVETRA